MKTINKFICAISLVVGLVSCNRAEFLTSDFIAIGGTQLRVKDDGSTLEIPVKIYSDKILSTEIAYTIAPYGDKKENQAILGVDYTLGDDSGILSITNDPDGVSDAIVIIAKDQTGTVQKNKKFKITLDSDSIMDENIHASPVMECIVTIVDTDVTIDMIYGKWAKEGTGESLGVSWTIEGVSEEDLTEEQLELYPDANLKIVKGSVMMADAFEKEDGTTADLTSRCDIFACYDSDEMVLYIYPSQRFETVSFTDGDYDLALDGFNQNSGLAPADFNFEPGLLTVNTDNYFFLYTESNGKWSTNYYYLNAFAKGDKIVKQEEE